MPERSRGRFNWAAVAILVAGAAMLLWAASNGHTAYLLWQLQRDGIVVEARLKRKDFTSSRNRTSYHVAYEFESADGAPRTGRSTVTAEHKEAWDAIGETLPVRYLPDDSSVNHWEVGVQDVAHAAQTATFGLGVLALLLLAVGTAAAFMTPEQYERWRHWGRTH